MRTIRWSVALASVVLLVACSGGSGDTGSGGGGTSSSGGGSSSGGSSSSGGPSSGGSSSGSGSGGGNDGGSDAGTHDAQLGGDGSSGSDGSVPAIDGGLDPKVAPGGNFDLSVWELQEPVGSPGSPTTISPTQLTGPGG